MGASRSDRGSSSWTQWALEGLLDRIDAARAGNDGSAKGLHDASERVKQLYRGDLFGADEDEPTAREAAERLRKRVERSLRAC